MRSLPLTVLLVLAGGAVFGLTDAVLWSSHSYTAASLGNISAPYLLLAFLAGWAVAARRAPLWSAASAGLAVTLVALATFYGWQVHHLAISSYAAHTGLRRYGAGGVVTGPIFGALGAVWARRRLWWAPAAVGLAFLFEPAAWKAHEGFQLIPANVRHGEFVAGLVILGVAAAAALHRPRST